MGKSVGLIGDISGKVGNVVFYTRNGVQVARVYVRNPNNPKSAAQNTQRLKMALAGRLSAIVPFDALEGMDGVGKSGRRSRFLKNVLLNSSVSGGVASITDSDVIFSEGSYSSVSQHSLSAGGSTAAKRTLNISTSIPAQTEVPEGYGERYVVLFMNEATSQFDYAITGLINLPEPGSSALTYATARVADLTSTYTAIAYVYPFASGLLSGAGFRSSYLGVSEGGLVVDQETGEVVSSGVVYGRSVFIGRVSIPVPAQSVSPSRGPSKGAKAAVEVDSGEGV